MSGNKNENHGDITPNWIVVFIFFLAGSFLGWIATNIIFKINEQGLQPARWSIYKSQYQYINPLLGIDTVEKKEFKEHKPLELKINNFFDSQKYSKIITDGSFYFRDLQTGRWAGLSEDATFSPGYLLKIPIMIAYFKQAESDPEVLQQTLSYDGSKANSTNIKLATTLAKGQSYTVDELIKRMIINSDDNATTMLFSNIDNNSLNEVFSDLGINFKEDLDHLDFISNKNYAIFYRILYNSTYLNHEMSNKALSLLAKSDPNIGIIKALPRDIKAAHKIGARLIKEKGQNILEFHDCGIIYFPNHPYILCLILKGKNETGMRLALQNIGQMVYQEIENKYK